MQQLVTGETRDIGSLVRVPYYWKFLRTMPDSEAGDEPDRGIDIGGWEMAMWTRAVSSGVCIVLYGRDLLAPLVMPGWFDGWASLKCHMIATGTIYYILLTVYELDQSYKQCWARPFDPELLNALKNKGAYE